MILGGGETDLMDIHQQLEEYEKQWLITSETDPDWYEAILQEKPNLFSMGYDHIKVNTESSNY